MSRKREDEQDQRERPEEYPDRQGDTDRADTPEPQEDDPRVEPQRGGATTQGPEDR